MADSKQLRILKRMTAHLEGITPSHGYDFDLTGKVFRGRTVFGADVALPYISILESLRPDPQPESAGSYSSRRADRWELLIQGWADAGDDAESFPTDVLYNLKASVEKRLHEILDPASAANYRFGGLIAEMRIGPGVVRAATPEPGGAEAFYLPLLITYAINLADPYA